MNVLPSSPVELCRAWRIEPGLPSVNLDETLTMNARLQSAILANVPDVAGVVARTGSDELGPDPMGPNQTDTFLVLKPADQRHTMDKPAPVNAACEAACSPAGAFQVDKYWPPVNWVDNVFGDRNLVCSCPSVDI